MEDRVVGQSDKHWIARILSDDPVVGQSKTRLYNALDLPPGALQDLQSKTNSGGSYDFFYEVLTRWISMNGRRAKFRYLLHTLKEETFVAAADHLADKCRAVDELSSRAGSLSLTDPPPKPPSNQRSNAPIHQVVEKSSETRNTWSQKPAVDKTKQKASPKSGQQPAPQTAPPKKSQEEPRQTKAQEKKPPPVKYPSEEEEDEMPAIVLDIGCASSKIGFAGDDEPLHNFPTVIGKDYSKMVVGEKALLLSKYDYPLKGGVVTDLDSMTKIWDHSFQTLLASPEGNKVLVMEPALVPKNNREKKTMILFETFEVSEFYLANQALMSLNAGGRSTGTVVQIGDGVTQVIPVYKDMSLPSVMQISTMGVSGSQLTAYMHKLLDERLNRRGQSSVGLETAAGIKEKLCYVALDFDKEMELDKSAVEKSYSLPGEVVKVGQERFLCPELLFQPDWAGIDSDGLHELIYKTIIKCPLSAREMLFSNIILAGGSTLFPGLVPRLQKELKELTSSTVDIKICAYDQLNSSWIGGSIVGSLCTTEWITKAEYDEYGPNIVHRKCQ